MTLKSVLRLQNSFDIMPRQRCSPEDEIANLQIRASEKAINISKKLVMEAMRQHPACAHDLVSKLQATGVLVKDTTSHQLTVDPDLGTNG